MHGRLRLPRDAGLAVTVAGTNGKGSCVAYLESIARAAGYRTGAYTSPHLRRFNERIRIGGEEAADEEIVAALERVDAARQDVSLTYFEYTTLAALLVFREHDTDFNVLEVGMGGRLDAVNVIDPAAAVVTSIGLDHCEWLGNDRELVAREKAGVFRPGRPAIVGDRDPPAALADTAAATGARLLSIGADFDWRRDANRWRWHGTVIAFDDLPLPAFGGNEQLDNAACALAAVEQLGPFLRVDRSHVAEGIRRARLDGRSQRVARDCEWVLDVAHNAEAAAVLGASLAGFEGRTIAVIALMQDKPVEGVARALADNVDEWIAVSDGSPRALSPEQLQDRLQGCVEAPVHCAVSLEDGLDAAAGLAGSRGRVLVTGSFRVVGPALDYLAPND